MRQPRSGHGGSRPDRRPHHISTIAHHFLPTSDEETSGTGVGDLELAVASPDGTPAAAFAAAGLLTGLSTLEAAEGNSGSDQSFGPGRALYLHETADPRWSAVTYLDSARFQSVGARGSRDVFSPGLGTGGSRQVLDEAESAEPGPRLSGGEIHVHHLGEVVGTLLEWTDARRALDPNPNARRGVRTGLVWCIQHREAESLTQALTLGRVLATLVPERLEILVFPDCWSGGDRQGWLDRIQNAARRGSSASRPDPVKIEELAGCLQPGIPVRVTFFDADGEGKMTAGCSAAMLDVARRLALP